MALALGLGACKPSPMPEPEPEPAVSEPVSPSLYLELRSLEGASVAAARVDLSSGRSGLASEQGSLLVEQLTPGDQVVLVRAQGFASSVLAFKLDEKVNAGVRLSLMPRGESLGSFDPSKDFSADKEGLQLTIPGGALLNDKGQLIQGQAEAFLAALDLDGGELVAAPGALEGIPSPGQAPVPLETLGIVALDIKGKDEVIDLARNIRVRGRVPGSVRVGSQGAPGSGIHGLRAQLTRPLPKAPIWRLDLGRGLWVPTGLLADIVESSTTPGTYTWSITMNNPPAVFAVALPAWWRSAEADPANPLRPPREPWAGSAALEVRVEDENGQPLPGRLVVARGENYVGLSRTVTDADGRGLLQVIRGEAVELSSGETTLRVPAVNDAGDAYGHGAKPTFVVLRVSRPECKPGAGRDCSYSGPESTLNVGTCRASRQTCDANGMGWSAACEGEVRPLEERCDNDLDDDCDGAVNETCSSICQEGQTRSCYGGPAGTEGVGVCRLGTQTCNGSGTAWGACTGEVTPQTEICANLADDDCDGLLNDYPPCVWGATGSPASPRVWHTATLLNDGKVIVAGGYSGSATLPTAEVYDPSTHSWSLTGPLNVPRYMPKAVLLGDGKLLVVGGIAGSTTKTAEVYDPGTNTWTSAASMSEVRANHTVTRLSNGKVLVVGGGNTSLLKTAEVYDPVGDTWTPAASMSGLRSRHTATRLNNGKVLVAGGTSGSLLNTAEVYDPDGDTWTPVASMNEPRAEHTAVLLDNGKVLVVGGFYLQTAEVYDPGNDTWTPVASMSTPRRDHTAVLLDNGKVLVVGGSTSSSILQSAEVYDPGGNTWSSAGTLLSPRYGHAATRLSNGQVLIVGGEDDTDYLGTAELYSP